MFGCCSAMTVKYISKDGLLDVPALKKFFGEETEVFKGHDGIKIKILTKVDQDNLTSDEMELVFARKELPEKMLRTHPLCTCPCHMVGSMVDC